MSFTLPSVKVKPSIPDTFGIHEEASGGQDLLKHGLSSAKPRTFATAIEASATKYEENVSKMNLALLRNTQGLHAPLRLAMELKSAKKIGRLPFLQSSNIMSEVLTGRDLEIGPEDIFNNSEFLEVSGQPHAVVEKSLGIL